MLTDNGHVQFHLKFIILVILQIIDRIGVCVSQRDLLNAKLKFWAKLLAAPEFFSSAYFETRF